MKTSLFSLALLLCAPALRPVSAQVIAPNYASDYSYVDLGSVPGVPGSYGGVTLKADDLNTLLIGGSANTAGAMIYSIGVVRGAGGHITGFTGTAVPYATAAGGGSGGIDGGLAYGPNDVLFYATYPDHRIDEIKPGSASPDKEIDLNSTSIGASLGALNFVPPGFASAGHIKIVSYGASTWNDAQVTPDGSGTFDITNIGPAIPLEAAPGPEGLIYVPMGNPDFSNDSVLVTSYGSGNIVAYQIDANGDPIPATAQNFVTGLAGAEGATVDPVTKDFLFSTFGGGNHVVVVRGFDALPFHDNFTGSASPVWGNEVGNWAAAGGVYAAQAPANSPPTYTGLPFVVDDFTFLVDVQQLQDGGIWLRSADNNNGILLVTGGNGGAGTGFYWQVVTAGSASAQMNPVSGLFVPGVSNAHLRVEVRGSTYAVYVDHAATPATTLTSSAFANGRVGLYDFSAQTFDNVTLSDRFAPAVSALAPGNLTPSSVTLNASVNPQGATTAVHFDYGPDANYGSSTPPQSIGNGTASLSASANLTGLTPHATYHFRAVASNAVDFVNGPDQSFIVPNSPPVAVDDSVATNGEAVSLDPTANDTDADLDALTVANFAQGAFGTVTSVGNVLTYTPGPDYFGSDSFGYTVSDSIDASAGTVTVHLDAPLARVVATSGRGTLGDLVPSGGLSGSGVPTEARWTGFGEPSWASNEVIAYIGKWKGPTGAGIGIFVGNRQIVKVGDSAPDALGNPMSGVAFGGFKDPLVDANGDLVFVATLKGTGVNNTNRIALIGFSGLGAGGPLTLLARTGVPMAAADGATLKTIKSVALSDSGYIIDFTAALTVGTGTPPVTSKTAATLWRIEDSGSPSLLLRPGLSYSFGSLGSQPLKAFGTLMVRGGSPGQGRGLIDNSLPVLAQTATAGTAIGYLGTSSGWSYTRLDDAPGYPAGTKFTSFNLPTQDLNSSLAFRASVKGGPLVGGTTALFAEDESHVLARLVTIGDPAPLPGNATFSGFKDPVSATGRRIAFLAVAKGDKINSTNNQGLFYRDQSGHLSVIAEKGAKAPETPDDNIFKSFYSIALPENSGGPLFTAFLTQGQGGVTRDNDFGLWGTDSAGTVHCLIREGDMLAGKTVKTFLVLKAVSGSPAQTRNFDDANHIVLRVSFVDGTLSIVEMALP